MFSALVFILNFIFLTFINMTMKIGSDGTSNLIAVCAMIVQTLALFCDGFISKGVLNKYRLQIFTGYLLRVFLIFFDIYGKNIMELPNSGADSETYYLCGVEYANTGHASRGGSYAESVGIVFKLVGTNRIFAQFMVCMCSLVILWLFAKTVELLLVNEDKAKMLMWVFCLLPNFAIMSSIFVREIPIAMFTAISVYLFLYWMRKNNIAALVLSFVSVMCGSYWHAGVSALCIGYIVVIFLYNARLKKFIFSASGLTFAILFAIAFLFLFVNYGDTFFQKFMNVEKTEDISNDRDAGGSSYAKYVGSSKNPFGMVIFTIPRIVYFLFSPFPWQWRDLRDIFSFIFSGMYYAVSIYFAIKTVREKYGEQRCIAIALLIIGFMGAFVFGWGVANTGTACRHRDKMVLLFGAMMINYFANLRPRNKLSQKELLAALNRKQKKKFFSLKDE